ncbi:MAG: glycosyltransferase family 39 protein [Phycisphaerae bacterium]|nr:glycosyltransferase family 39 protein [Phycisphaerae bacterium]
MSDPLPDAPAWHSCFSRKALLLIALITFARLVYIAFLCPYNLVEDEAQYWVWSTRPDWSYYSKGPGIAWSMWASTHLFGNTEFGVRAFAPLYAAITALAIAGLSADATRDRRAAFAGAALFYLIPAFIISGTFLMTIDGPMLALWAIACWAAFRAFYRASRRAWLVLGLALGIGFLFKYTIALLIPSLILVCFLDRPNLRIARPLPLRISIVLLCIALGLLPIAIWNSQNGWPAISHFLGHAKLPGGDRPPTAQATPYSPKWFFEFIGIQLAAIGPALVLMWLGFRALRGTALPGGVAPTFPSPPEQSKSASPLIFLACTSLPTLLFYLGATFLTSVEANWPIGGYISLIPLGAFAVIRGMSDWRERMARWHATPLADRTKQGYILKRPETPPQIAWHCTLAIGIIVSILILRLDLIARLPGLEGKLALHRLMGAPQFARAIQSLSIEHSKPNPTSRSRDPKSPLLISYHYGVAAQLTFYLPNHPMVFVAGSHMGYRRTQWDLWPDMSLTNPDLEGDNALLIGATESQWKPHFRAVADLGHLPEDLRMDRWVYFGEGFLLFDRPIEAPQPRSGT